MPKIQSTLWMLALVVALGGWLWALRENNTGEASSPYASGRFWTESGSSMVSMAWIEGDAVWQAERRGGGWLLREPVLALADSRRVEALLRHVSGIQADQVLLPRDVRQLGYRPAELGLVSPVARFVVTTRSGREVSLKIGQATPDGAGLYAGVGTDETVWILPRSAVDPLRTGGALLERKDLLRGSSADAARIELTTTGGVVRMDRRAGGRWTVSGWGQTGEGHPRALDSWVRALFDQPVLGAVEPLTYDFDDLGLGEDSMRIAVTDRDARSAGAWRIGRPVEAVSSPDSGRSPVYAAPVDGGPVVTVPGAVVPLLQMAMEPSSLDSLRSGGLFFTTEEHLLRIQAEDVERPWVLVRDDPTPWILSPAAGGTENAEVEALLQMLREMERSPSLAAPPSPDPLWRLRLVWQDPESSPPPREALLTAFASEDPAAPLHIRTEVPPGREAVWSLVREHADKWRVLDRLRFRTRTILRIPPEAIRRLSLAMPGGTQSVVCAVSTDGSMSFRPESASAGVEVREEALQHLVTSLQWLRGETVVADGPMDPTRYVPDPPDFSLTIDLQGPSGIGHILRFGRPSKGRDYVQVQGRETVLRLSSNLVSDVSAPFWTPLAGTDGGAP